jgi:uncharacterized membrane protein
MRRTGSFLALAFALVLAPGLTAQAQPAQAGFHVCNKTGLTTRLALGHFDGTHWSSEGWWTIKPKTCVSILTGALNARYYYLYATDQAAGTWEGPTHFCVAPQKRFRAVGRADCAKRGFDRRGFFEVETGNKPDWTQNLSN